MLNSLNGLLSRKNDVPSPTVISLGQVWVDIMMDIDAIPQPGGFAVANHTMPSVGGSFRVMQAASRIGAATKHAGVIGNGPWASLIRKALNDNGIEHIGQDRIDADSGFRLVLNDSERKTFVATYGAESQGNENTFDCVEPGEGDVVHISANTLMDHRATTASCSIRPTRCTWSATTCWRIWCWCGPSGPATVRRPARSPTGLACSWTIPCR